MPAAALPTTGIFFPSSELATVYHQLLQSKSQRTWKIPLPLSPSRGLPPAAFRHLESRHFPRQHLKLKRGGRPLERNVTLDLVTFALLGKTEKTAEKERPGYCPKRTRVLAKRRSYLPQVTILEMDFGGLISSCTGTGLPRRSPRRKHLLRSSGEKKQGRGGKRGLFAVVFCLESGWSRGPSAAAPPNSHRKEEIILHGDKRYRRQKQQFRERTAWPPDDVRLLEATARLKSSRDAVFVKGDSASSSPKDNFIRRSALLSIKTRTGWKFPSCQPHAGSPRLRLPLREGCAPPRSELLRAWLAPSEMKSPRFVGARWKLRALYRRSSSAQPQPLLL